MYLKDLVFPWEGRREKQMNRAIGCDSECQGRKGIVTEVWETRGCRWSRVRRPSMGLAFEKETKNHVWIYDLDKWLAVWRKAMPLPLSQEANSLKQFASKDLSFLGHTGICVTLSSSTSLFRLASWRSQSQLSWSLSVLVMGLSSGYVPNVKRAMYD